MTEVYMYVTVLGKGIINFGAVCKSKRESEFYINDLKKQSPTKQNIGKGIAKLTFNSETVKQEWEIVYSKQGESNDQP